MKSSFVLMVLVLAVTAVPAAANGVCLHRSQVQGWHIRDKHSVIVDDSFGRKYLLGLGAGCEDISWSSGLAFRPIGGGFSMCVDRGERITVLGNGPSHDVCWVRTVQLYTPDMEHADRMAKANRQPLAAY